MLLIEERTMTFADDFFMSTSFATASFRTDLRESFRKGLLAGATFLCEYNPACSFHSNLRSWKRIYRRTLSRLAPFLNGSKLALCAEQTNNFFWAEVLS